MVNNNIENWLNVLIFRRFSAHLETKLHFTLR